MSIDIAFCHTDLICTSGNKALCRAATWMTYESRKRAIDAIRKAKGKERILK